MIKEPNRVAVAAAQEQKELVNLSLIPIVAREK